MKKTKFSESKIFKILKEAESGVPVPELCRTYGFSNASFYNWRSKYGGMDVSSMRRLKELEEENRRLKKMYRKRCQVYFPNTTVCESEAGEQSLTSRMP